MKIKTTLTALVLLGGLSGNLLNAELAVSNYNYPVFQGAIGFDADFGSEMQWGVGFTTGTNVGGYQLDGISLFFGDPAFGTPGPLTIEIYTDDGAGEFNAPDVKAPGVQDFTVASGDPLTGGASVSFDPVVAIPSILESNTTYWAVVSADLSGDPGAYYNWLTAVGGGFDDALGDGWSISEGSSYSYVPGGDGFATNLPPGLIEISATAVPEPQAYALLLSALALGYVALRRGREKGANV